MKSAFVSRHFSWLFDCQSRILHFAIWLLFLVVSCLECGSKCRAVNKAEIRITWLMFYFCWHIFHPHRKKKNYITELSFYWHTLNSPEADNQFNFNFLHRKISTFWNVWDKLTCSHPLSVLKFLTYHIFLDIGARVFVRRFPQAILRKINI